MRKGTGGFTLPGEAGYEKLTLELAEKWGADVIRDSDGTKLSDDIVKAGYGIYSTICLIRGHNDWLKEHMDCLQQTFLMTKPVIAGMDGEKLSERRPESVKLVITLLESFYQEQFRVNETGESVGLWQVFDRTTGQEIRRDAWSFSAETGAVVIQKAVPYHTYTVNFLAYRIWEEISMYNHVTNGWDKEHLMPVDPRRMEAQQYLYEWLEHWCEENPDTTVVRFTSMFYNFVWIWGAGERNRNLFSDWGSYDFTVSPQALKEFEEMYGYRLTSEDFIHQGKLHVTHMEPTARQMDYIAFTNRFVVDFGRRLVELVHKYKKLAYVFYDDSWVGVEPYLPTFREFGFDGIIKCIFSGYEVRLCAGVDVPVHEVRLHPYLFPVGLGGAATFSEGGDPLADAKRYWKAARRAMLRCKIDRIGLGGYLHLAEPYSGFLDYIEQAAGEFRMLKELWDVGPARTLDVKAAVLTAWGSMRSWTLSGHFHETYMHDLIHVNEALAGLPVEVDYINFEDVLAGKAGDYDVIINAGMAKSAWSGGSRWADDAVVEELTRWTAEGGMFLGIYQPSMVEGYPTSFRMAQVLGVDLDTGERCCHGKPVYELDEAWRQKLTEGLCSDHDDGAGDVAAVLNIKPEAGIWLVDEDTSVIAETVGITPIGEEVHTPSFTVHEFGNGKGVYLSHFTYSVPGSRLLLNLLLSAGRSPEKPCFLCDNVWCECAYFPDSETLAVMNLSEETQKTKICTGNETLEFVLKPDEIVFEKRKE